jgi:hypothetical protein
MVEIKEGATLWQPAEFTHGFIRRFQQEFEILPDNYEILWNWPDVFAKAMALYRDNFMSDSIGIRKNGIFYSALRISQLENNEIQYVINLIHPDLSKKPYRILFLIFLKRQNRSRIIFKPQHIQPHWMISLICFRCGL